MIKLGIGKIGIFYGKNNDYFDFSPLFQKTDLQDIPYYYADDVVIHEEGFSKPICSIKRRLELMGYTLDYCKQKYLELLEQYDFIEFDLFIEILNSMDIREANILKPPVSEKWPLAKIDFWHYLGHYINLEEKLKETSAKENFDEDCEFMYCINPLILLRIICEKKEYADLELQWGFSEVVENGWVRREDLIHDLDKRYMITIVTEGSTDTEILKKAMNAYQPDVCDFFSYIDMTDNYPFTGTGNLGNFFKGLMKINILNNMLFVIDNDTEGNQKYLELNELERTDNLKIFTLPNYDSFDRVITIGPNGNSEENINGKAVSIECFLDFSALSDEPKFRWTSYNKKMETYQGELEQKREIHRYISKIGSPNYNSEKLLYLTSYLIKRWNEKT